MNGIQVVAAIIRREDSVLIAKRPIDKHKGGLWEFPGGKIETGESAEAALVREIREEIDIKIVNPQIFSSIDFDYPEKRVSLHFFIVTEYFGKPAGLEGQEIRWVKLDQLVEYQFPEANQPVVKALVGKDKTGYYNRVDH